MQEGRMFNLQFLTYNSTEFYNLDSSFYLSPITSFIWLMLPQCMWWIPWVQAWRGLKFFHNEKQVQFSKQVPSLLGVTLLWSHSLVSSGFQSQEAGHLALAEWLQNTEPLPPAAREDPCGGGWGRAHCVHTLVGDSHHVALRLWPWRTARATCQFPTDESVTPVPGFFLNTKHWEIFGHFIYDAKMQQEVTVVLIWSFLFPPPLPSTSRRWTSFSSALFIFKKFSILLFPSIDNLGLFCQSLKFIFNYDID